MRSNVDDHVSSVYRCMSLQAQQQRKCTREEATMGKGQVII